MKKAFTLIELVMVIVIMGIISAIGADIIGTMYTNYLRSKAVDELQSQSDIAIQLISKRLSHRVRGSEAVVRGAGVVPISSQADTDTILTWIGVSSESRNGLWNAAAGRVVPGWSGLVDLPPVPNPATTTIVSPGSHLNNTNTIIQALTNGVASFANGNIAFIPKTSKATNVANYYNNTNTNYTIRVNMNANNTYRMRVGDGLPIYPDGTTKGITNEYYLSHTAYAIVATGAANNMTLWLHYNYQPWNNQNYLAGQRRVVARGVSTFRFRRYGGGIYLKLCLQDANLNTATALSACKETVVF